MRKEKLDDLIKNKLESYSSSVPDHIWEGISAQIDKPSSDKGAFFNPSWRLMGAASAILAIFIYSAVQYSNSTSSLEDDGQNIVLETVKNTPSVSTQSTASIRVQNTASIDQHTDSYIVQDGQETNFDEQNASQARTLVSTEIPTNTVSSYAIEEQSRRTLLIIAEDVDEPVDYNRKKIKVSEQEEKTEVVEVSSAKELSRIPNIASLFQLKSNPIPIFKKGQCADFRENRNMLFWSMSYSLDKPIRSIRSRTESMNEYAALRANTETPASAFSVNMNLGLRLKNNMVFRTGLNYSRLKENFKHDIETSREITISNVYDNNGALIATDTSVNIFYETLRNVNLYETVDIPVLFGIERSKKNFGLGFYTGALVNVSFSKSGAILSPDDPDKTIRLNGQGDSGAFFNHRLGFSLYTSAMVSYSFNSRVQVNIEPYVKYSPASFSNSNYMVDQNYYIIGGQLGLRYYL